MDNPVRTIQDSQSRQITLGGDGNNIVAEHNGNEIGRFDFDISEDDFKSTNLLTNCNVDPAYQRSGIGTEMMKLAEEWYDDFSVVEHFSTKGAALMNHCTQHVFQKSHSTIKDDRY